MKIDASFWWKVLIFFLGLIFLGGLWINIMDVDASQYASIAMEMLYDGSWLEVKHRHADYLDKPPLLFWLSAASFKLFGLSNWSYKLPSLLGGLLGVYSVYRFSQLYYPERVARYAALMLASCLGFLVITNDVRTDTLLLGLGAAAVWQLAAFYEKNQWKNFVAAFVFIGLAMTAKGPIGLVMPGFALGTHLLMKRDWKSIFQFKWIVGLVISVLVLLPMCWGLYHQFDLQPEKVIHGRQGVSGLYFFFWEQSFGRITGENVWKNDASALYFVHVYGWAFLPWVGLFYVVFIKKIIQLIKDKFRLPEGAEAMSLGAFFLTFVALSMSRYKLPHYVFVTLPWASVLCAAGLHAIFHEKEKRAMWPWWLLYFTILLLFTLTFAVLFWIFPTTNLWVLIPTGLLLLGWMWQLVRDPFPLELDPLIQRGFWAIVIMGFVMNFHFYPSLLPHQSTSSLMEWANEKGRPAENRAWFKRHGHALDFYARHILPEMESPEAIREFADDQGQCLLYTNEEGKSLLDEAGMEYVVDTSMLHFQVALLNARFLNPATRDSACQPVYLLQIDGTDGKGN